MAALDTSVLVRFLVGDEAAQAAAAARLLRRAAADSVALFVPITVALETEWVLRYRYGYERGQVAHALSATELSFEAESALELALLLYDEGRADFSDCLRVALAVRAGEQPLSTFDKAAAKLPDAQLLPA